MLLLFIQQLGPYDARTCQEMCSRNFDSANSTWLNIICAGYAKTMNWK